MSCQAREQFAFIESNTTGTGRLFIEEVINLGYEVLFLSKNPEKYPFLEQELIHPVLLDTENFPIIFNYLKNFQNLRAVFSSSDFFTEIASKLSKDLGLISNNIEAIQTCRNKFKLYEKLKAANILTPQSRVAKNLTETLEIFDGLKKPVIIKPCAGSGSIGVRLCSNPAEIHEHLGYLLEQETLIAINSNTPLLIQEYIEGSEYSVESLSYGGRHKIIGITKKYLSDPPLFIESGHDFPAVCDSRIKEIIENSVNLALNCVGYTVGPAHTEVRISDQKAYIIEINPRLAGGMIPSLIKAATGVDLIKQTVNLLLGKDLELQSNKNRFASIRFFIANSSGKIKHLRCTQDLDRPPIATQVQQFKFTKQEGDSIALKGDYRDRLGYVITQEESLEKSAEAAQKILQKVEIQIEDEKEVKVSKQNINNNIDNYDYTDTGILKQTLNREALQIINRINNFASTSVAFKNDFHYFALIDEIHLLMLYQCQILTKQDLYCILKEISRLRTEDFQTLLLQKMERGTYLLYERELINKLGIKIAGKIHTARSRNDLHETIFRLKTRESFFKIYHALWRLRSKILNLASKTQSLAFPIYSQYQTALPGTFAHYLLGISESLKRDQFSFQEYYRFLNISPLGACAGSGTSHLINCQFTAKLLGFDDLVRNSLDAIASKDLALRFLAQLMVLATNLSRLAEDLQLWSSLEFKFIRFGDELLGGSSMMPQKRNPYLLEAIKAKSAELLGCLSASFSSVMNTPFGNSYETKLVTSSNTEKASLLICDGLDLMRIILGGIEFMPSNINKSLVDNLTVASLVSETLMKNGHTAKEAHQQVGAAIFEAEKCHKDPNKQISQLLPSNISFNLDDPLSWAHSFEHGFGPGKNHTDASLNSVIQELNQDSLWWRSKMKALRESEKIKESLLAQIHEH